MPTNKHHQIIAIILAAFAMILLFPIFAQAQVPVALLPNPRITFFDGNGLALQNGCIAFYNAGTSTPAPIYSDFTGTFQLPNPLTLDSSGSATVWLANQSYKVVASTGVSGQTCASSPGIQLWVVDNVSAYQIINQAQNIFLAGATSDPAGVAGELAYRTDLGKVRFFSTLWDSVVGETTPATLTNKTVNITANTLTCTPNTAGLFLRDDGTKLQCVSIGTFDLPSVLNPDTIENFYTNNPTTGTVFSSLAKIAPGPFYGVQTTTTADTGGVLGICVANCTTAGNAEIAVMSNGIACNFDAAPTVAGDYVTISSTNAGACHDAGAAYPSTQVLGRVLNTGTSIMILFPAEQHGGSGSAYPANTTPVTVASSAAETVLQGIALSPNDLNIAGTQLTVQGWIPTSGTTGTPNLTIRVRLDSAAGVLLGTFPVFGDGGSYTFSMNVQIGTVTTGTTGTLEVQGNIFINTLLSPPLTGQLANTSTIVADLTAGHTIYFTAQWGAGSSSNTITQRLMTAHR